MSLFLLFIPSGYVLADLLRLDQDQDLLVRLALWSGLSTALIPVALLWLTLAHIQVTASLVRGTFLVISLLAFWRWLARRRHRSGSWPGSQVGSSRRRRDELTNPRVDGVTRQHSVTPVVVAAVLFLAAILCFWPLTELALPSWIDSVHHVMVTRLILDRGGIPESYQPFLPVPPFLYHFGFHALSAVFVWLADVDPARAVLVVGQTLNFLAPLGACWLALRLTGMRWAGAISALAVGTISLMPTYFVNWGRYTHLAGMSLLPAVIVLTVDAVGQHQRSPGAVLAAALALVGLALTHYRVLVFALVYLVIYLVSLLIPSRWTLVQQVLRPRRWRQGQEGRIEVRCEHSTSGPVPMGRWRRIAAMATIALLLAFPWLIRLTHAALGPDGIWSGLAVDAAYNAFPHDLLLASVNRSLAVLAAWGWLLALWRQARSLIAVGLWVPALFLAANPQVIGMRGSPLITNSSVLISLYLPLSLLTGYLVAGVASEVEKRMDEPWRDRFHYVLAAAIVLVALWGVRSLWPVITPETVLADEEDLLALSWIRDNTPPQARFLISTRHWQANIYVGTDGGYWIPALTGRQTTVPPALYIQGAPEYVARVNALAQITAEGPDVDEASFREMLIREGVTHVYLGARGSSLPRQALLDSTHYALAYAGSNVWVFEVLREG